MAYISIHLLSSAELVIRFEYEPFNVVKSVNPYFEYKLMCHFVYKCMHYSNLHMSKHKYCTNTDLNICHSIFENVQTKILYDRDYLNFARSSIKYEWNTLKTFFKGWKIHFANKRNYILNTCTMSIPSPLNKFR